MQTIKKSTMQLDLRCYVQTISSKRYNAFLGKAPKGNIFMSLLCGNPLGFALMPPSHRDYLAKGFLIPSNSCGTIATNNANMFLCFAMWQSISTLQKHYTPILVIFLRRGEKILRQFEGKRDYLPVMCIYS